MKLAINTLVATGVFFGLIGQVHAAARDVTCPVSFQSAIPNSSEIRITSFFQYPGGRHIRDSQSEPVMPILSIVTPISSEADLYRLKPADWDKMMDLAEAYRIRNADFYSDIPQHRQYVDADRETLLAIYRCFRNRAAGVSYESGARGIGDSSSGSSSHGGTNTSGSASSRSSSDASVSANNRTPKKDYQNDPDYKVAVAKQCPWTFDYQGMSYGVTVLFPNYAAGYVVHNKFQRFEMPQLSVRTPITTQEQLNQLTTQDWVKLEKAYTDLNLALVSPEEARKMDSPTRREIFGCYSGRAQAIENAKYGAGSSGSSSGASEDSGRAPYLSGKCVKFSNAGAGVSDDYKRISNLCNKKIAVAYCEYTGSDVKRCQTSSDEAWSTSGTMRVGGSTMFSARFGAARNQRVSYYVCDMTKAAKLCLPPKGRFTGANDGSIGN